MFNPLDSKGNNSATSNNTMDVNGRDVTFDTARRGLGGLRPSRIAALYYRPTVLIQEIQILIQILSITKVFG